MSKKLIIALACTSVVSSTLVAQEGLSERDTFIGVEVGYTSVQGDVGTIFEPFIEHDYDGSDVEFGVRIGAQSEEWRTTLGFNYFDGKDGDKKQNYEKWFLSVDYLFLGSDNNPLQPFIGLNVGYVNYESTQGIDMNGFVYGAQVGLIYSVTENIDLDLQYRYSLSGATQDDRNAELDHISGVVFGVNYKY